MVAMVPLLTPVSGYYTTFYNHIAMVLTPLRDHGKTMAEPQSILPGVRIKGTMNFIRINDMLSLNVTGLSQRDDTDK